MPTDESNVAAYEDDYHNTTRPTYPVHKTILEYGNYFIIKKVRSLQK